MGGTQQGYNPGTPSPPHLALAQLQAQMHQLQQQLHYNGGGGGGSSGGGGGGGGGGW
jgi:hypothetical protein